MQQCGFIMSPGYPLDYSTNQKCAWKITVNRNAYIKLSFLEFDIFEDGSDECNRDLVEVIDSDRLGEQMVQIVKFNFSYLI